MIYLDTSALIRFFTNDDKNKAEKVGKLLDGSITMSVADVVFPEIEYVLQDGYDATRKEILLAFTFLSSKKNLHISPNVRKAIELYKRSQFDIADCIIAVSSARGQLASFDKKLLSLLEVKPYWD